ncbi:uncharacterized protein LOC134540091 [Bacillus rossius redtenbacheri]|uniref:uncharacterized protein LOC134540091 n=1 Tax=Bacillus rossius redtenbacheri TaxID=93214 RepID=UPI002FDD0496
MHAACLTVLAVAALAALAGPALADTFVFRNQHGSTVWIGALGNAGKPAPNGGGFAVGPNQQVTVTTANDWAGRFWARTGCSFSGNTGHCATGDCGNKLACNGAGGVPPVTLAEFTLGNMDYYDVSLVDGYNVGLTIKPQNKAAGGTYNCNVAGCLNNLNTNCPAALRQTSGGATVACKSACLAFNTDEYCCRGSHNTPATCKPASWPQNYAAYFKNNCRNAYSYAYDDTTSTYTCSDTGYIITVG